MAEVVKLVPSSMGDGFRFDANALLDDFKDTEIETLIVIAENDGVITVRGNANTGEALLLMERAKHALVFAGD